MGLFPPVIRLSCHSVYCQDLISIDKEFFCVFNQFFRLTFVNARLSDQTLMKVMVWLHLGADLTGAPQSC